MHRLRVAARFAWWVGVALTFASPASAASILVVGGGSSLPQWKVGGSEFQTVTALISARFQRVDFVQRVSPAVNLQDYDAIWLDQRLTLANPSLALDATETALLADYFESGQGRLVMIGENSNWQAWNESILALVGGTFLPGLYDGGTPIVDNELTAGVAEVAAQGAGGAAGPGTQLFTSPFATLWSDDAVTVLDINTLRDSGCTVCGLDPVSIETADNTRFVTNIIAWAAVPEPAPAPLIALGFAAMVAWRKSPLVRMRPARRALVKAD
jgi:hypothetical protein